MVAVSLSVAIMAHPSRRHLVRELHRNLGRPVPVVWDRHGDRWDTGRRAWLEFDQDATHHLVIQDDALPAPGLLAGLERVLPLLSERDAAMCLYTGRVREHRLSVGRYVKGYPSWMAMNAIQWGVGIVLPVGHIAKAVEFGDSSTIPNYDSRLSEYWLQALAGPVLYPLPSWVEHATTPSLIEGRNGRRKSLRALGSTPVDPDEWLAAPVYRVPDFVRRGAGAKPTGR